MYGYSISLGFRTIRTTTSIPMNQTDLRDLSLPAGGSEGIDARLIYLASIGTTGQIIDIRGNAPRTSASDAAVLELTTILNNELWEDV